MRLPSTATSSFFFGAVLLSTLFGSANADYTQYDCKSGEYCEVKAVPLFRRNLQSCTPTFPSGPSGSGSAPSQFIPPFRSLEGIVESQCMAFPSSLLVGNGGLCIVTCPSSCVVTKNVMNPCSASSTGVNTSGGSITGTVGSTNTSGGSTTTTGTSMNISGGNDKFGTTEVVCNSGERCTLTASTGSQCRAEFEGLPSNFMYSPSTGGTMSLNPMQCFGIKNSRLVSGGGVCKLSCPNTCKVTKDVSGSVCASSSSSSSSSSGFEDDDDSPASMRTLSAITTVAIAGVAAMMS